MSLSVGGVTLGASSPSPEEEKPAPRPPPTVDLHDRMVTLLQDVRNSVTEKGLHFTFACGGAIPIQQLSSQHVDSDPTIASPVARTLPQAASPPVRLRWDPQDATIPASRASISFPLDSPTRGNLEQLLTDMQPATFGLGGVDVYDETYRKATKLDPERFSSSFNPYELGIVDTIAQTLLPTLRQGKHTRAVKAELYKLNVYSGPSGKFKSHVDTPRSPSQFGSLVVCLPLGHNGGALQIRHQGQTVTFDWGGGDPQSIQWAAFYSDCEHEVLEVTQGHRVTLTYNLYCVRGNGQLGGSCPALDPRQLPMYATLREIMFDKSWAENGYIGYHCSHTYPHTTDTTLNFLPPDNLKGADMLMYEIFRSFGLQVLFRPTMEDRDCIYRRDREEVEEWEWDGGPPVAIGLSRKLEVWVGERQGDTEWNEWTGKEKKEAAPQGFRQRRNSDFLAFKLSQHSRYIDGKVVHWVDEPGHEESQVSWVYYGNQAEPRMTYSSLALVAVVPKGGAENATDIAANTSEEPEGSWEQTKIVSEFWDSELRKWRKEVLLEGPGPCLTEVTPEGKQEAARQRDIEEMQRYYQEKHSSGIHQKRGSWRY